VQVKSVQCNAVLLGVVGVQAESNKCIEQAKGVTGVRGGKSFLTANK
jgi:hyperosmotically inducible protein